MVPVPRNTIRKKRARWLQLLIRGFEPAPIAPALELIFEIQHDVLVLVYRLELPRKGFLCTSILLTWLETPSW